MLWFLVQPALTRPDIQNLTFRRSRLRALARELRAHPCLAVGSKTDSSQIRPQCLHEPWSLGDCRVSTLSEPPRFVDLMVDIPRMDTIMPKGFFENTQEIYAEVASYPIVPPEKIKQYWNGT